MQQPLQVVLVAALANACDVAGSKRLLHSVDRLRPCVHRVVLIRQLGTKYCSRVRDRDSLRVSRPPMAGHIAL